jgi:predicted O-linked N-acetylglucosamine transferase (SPINDLY family)
MTATASSPRLADAKSALDRGDPATAAEVARAVANASGHPAEIAQALHFAGLMELEASRGAPAFQLIRKALAIAPERTSAYANLAQIAGISDNPVRLARIALCSAPRSEGAWSAYAIASAEAARFARANRRFETAIRHSRRAIMLRPDYAEALQGFNLDSRWLCRMDDPGCRFDRIARLVARIRVVPGHPLTLLAPHATPADQRRAAEKIVRSLPTSKLRPRLSGESRAKIRVGYVCSYLKDHAMAEALPELLGCHDRERFRVRVYATPNGDGDSAWNEAIQTAAGDIVDLGGLSPEDQAERIRNDGIEILADLDGFLADRPLGLLSHRPAPILVNYFGFPGTCGGLHDYIVGDGRLIRQSDTVNYSERIVRLPHCYMPFDGTRQIPPPPSRKSAGLPEDALVFLGFHSQNKIAADAFAAWMVCLREVPGSVLWMLDHGALCRTNIRAAAHAAGVAPERIVFASKAPAREHVARLALADLYLDSTWFNAHTTGADALWRGVPVITVAGDTFAARVGASLLTAAGLPDLIASTPEEQAGIAIALARAPKRLSALRLHLERARKAAPLFDMRTYTAALERAYLGMIARARMNLPPADITISP